MNENTGWIPTHDPQADSSVAGYNASDPYSLLQWLSSQDEHDSAASEHATQTNVGPEMGPQRTRDLPYDYAFWQQYGAYSPDAPKPSRRNGFLSPLPLRGMQQLVSSQDTIAPPTLTLPESSLPLASSSYSNAHTSLNPNYISGYPLSPHSTPSHLPAPTYPHVWHDHLPVPLASGPSFLNYTNSPGEASTSSYHSFPSSPEVSTYYSLSPAPSPATHTTPLHNNPAHEIPSTQPLIPSGSATQPRPRFSPDASLTPTSSLRTPLKQTLKCTSKWEESFKETFKVAGVTGVPVREILKDNVVLDGHDERVLERTGVRQIRLVIAWPGYEHVGKYIHVQEKDGFITRSRFAKLVCSQLSRFMDRAAKRPPQQGHARWTIGRQGITLDKLWLLSVRPAQQNIWLADLEVLL